MTENVNLKEGVKELCQRFHKDGYLFLEQVFQRAASNDDVNDTTKDDDNQIVHLLQPWQDFANTYFEQVFKTLHHVGHTKISTHKRHENSSSTNSNNSGDNENSSSNNHIKSTAEDYVLGLGVKNGFREVVMRSPGRFELSLLHLLPQESQSTPILQQEGNHHNNTTNQQQKNHMTPPTEPPVTMPPIEPLRRVLEKIVSPLLSDDYYYNNVDSTGSSDKDDDNTDRNITLVSLSLVVSTPGACAQAWHADGGHIDLSTHQPCHVLNVFLPLQDVYMDMGPTRVRPETHYITRDLTRLMLLTKCKKTLRAPTTPGRNSNSNITVAMNGSNDTVDPDICMRVGDALIFDYRLLHCGLANNSNRNRTFLVLTFSKPWYKKDVLNFPSKSMYEINTNTA